MADECDHLGDRPFFLLLVDISLDHLFNVLFSSCYVVAYEDEEDKKIKWILLNTRTHASHIIIFLCVFGLSLIVFVDDIDLFCKW